MPSLYHPCFCFSPVPKNWDQLLPAEVLVFRGAQRPRSPNPLLSSPTWSLRTGCLTISGFFGKTSMPKPDFSALGCSQSLQKAFSRGQNWKMDQMGPEKLHLSLTKRDHLLFLRPFRWFTGRVVKIGTGHPFPFLSCNLWAQQVPITDSWQLELKPRPTRLLVTWGISHPFFQEKCTDFWNFPDLGHWFRKNVLPHHHNFGQRKFDLVRGSPSMATAMTNEWTTQLGRLDG